MRMRYGVMIPLMAVLAACSGAGATDPIAAHRAGVDAWYADRVARLTQPDGWLSLVGLHWLESGAQSVGCAEDNAVVLMVGPPHLGTVTLADGEVRFEPAAGVAFSVDGKPGDGVVTLQPDSRGEPTVLGFGGGRASLVLIERSGRMALRVRDAQAPTRTGFKGIARYPVDIGWRFDARFEPHPPGKTIAIASVINTLDDMVNSGVVVFEKDGHEHRLEAVDEGDGRIFLVFGDHTNGRETYGAGRFLYAGPVDANGHTVVDFNQSYNPPCALNAYSTCPLPPPENRLDLTITAGELKYEGPGH